MALTEREAKKLDDIADGVSRIDERTEDHGRRLGDLEKGAKLLSDDVLVIRTKVGSIEEGQARWRDSVESKVDQIRKSVVECQRNCGINGLFNNISAADKKMLMKVVLGILALVLVGSAGGQGVKQLIEQILALLMGG